jgi:hypothetical protein
MGGNAVNRPRAADDLTAIKARMEELRREREGTNPGEKEALDLSGNYFAPRFAKSLAHRSLKKPRPGFLLSQMTNPNRAEPFVAAAD